MVAPIDKFRPVIGSSTTQLFTNLSLILPRFPPDSEIILSRVDHEANISPWVRLATHIQPGLKIKWWTPPSVATNASAVTEDGRNEHEPWHNPLLRGDNLEPLLTDKTVLVACTHSSNILGSIHDIERIANVLEMSYDSPTTRSQESVKPKFPNTLKPFLIVDGVAYAPHRQLKMHEWLRFVDFYSFSWYKVFGPHIAILYASRRVQQGRDLGSAAHYFYNEGRKSSDLDLETKLGLAGSSYELVASIPKLVEYFSTLAQTSGGDAWSAIAKHEESLARILIDYIQENRDKYGLTLFGSPNASSSDRVSVVSFGVRGRSSRDVVESIEKKTGGKIGCRWGHFYSKRLVDDILGQGGEKDGVVRVSMVHYNTSDEVQELITVLDHVLAEGHQAA